MNQDAINYKRNLGPIQYRATTTEGEQVTIVKQDSSDPNRTILTASDGRRFLRAAHGHQIVQLDIEEGGTADA